jgi:hypothetical protein
MPQRPGRRPRPTRPSLTMHRLWTQPIVRRAAAAGFMASWGGLLLAAPLQDAGQREADRGRPDAPVAAGVTDQQQSAPRVDPPSRPEAAKTTIYTLATSLTTIAGSPVWILNAKVGRAVSGLAFVLEPFGRGRLPQLGSVLIPSPVAKRRRRRSGRRQAHFRGCGDQGAPRSLGGQACPLPRWCMTRRVHAPGRGHRPGNDLRRGRIVRQARFFNSLLERPSSTNPRPTDLVPLRCSSHCLVPAEPRLLREKAELCMDTRAQGVLPSALRLLPSRRHFFSTLLSGSAPRDAARLRG